MNEKAYRAKMVELETRKVEALEKIAGCLNRMDDSLGAIEGSVGIIAISG